jgi:hypothetical protein
MRKEPDDRNSYVYNNQDTTSYSTVKKYIRKIKKRQNIFLRINTAAGEEY